MACRKRSDWSASWKVRGALGGHALEHPGDLVHAQPSGFGRIARHERQDGVDGLDGRLTELDRLCVACVPCSLARVSAATRRRPSSPCPTTMPQSAQTLLMTPPSWRVWPAVSAASSAAEYTAGTSRRVRVKTMRSSGSMTTCSASHIRLVRRARRCVQERPSRSHSVTRSGEAGLPIACEVTVARARPQCQQTLVHATRTSIPIRLNGSMSTFGGRSSSKPGAKVSPQAAYFPPAARL